MNRTILPSRRRHYTPCPECGRLTFAPAGKLRRHKTTDRQTAARVWCPWGGRRVTTP